MTGPRRTRGLRAGGILAAVVALVMGLAVWLTPGASVAVSTAEPPDQAPFDAALLALASAPQVHYRSVDPVMGLVDVRVTSADELVGTLTDAGQSYGLLRVGGRLYLKPPGSGLPNVTNAAENAALKDKWLTGRDVTDLLGTIPSDFDPPSALAARLAAALDDTAAFPPAGSAGTTVDGVPALSADTPIGSLDVTRSKPYRVVRFTPGNTVSSSSSANPAAYARTAAAASDQDPLDVLPEQPSDLAGTYRELRQDTGQLSTAIDSDLQFDLHGNAQISCGDGGCQVTATVTSSVSAGSTGGTVVGGRISAQLTATITIEGQATDGCTSTGTLPVDGTGTIGCSDPGAGAVFASVESEKRNAALAQSQAEGGVSVPYYVHYQTESYVYATAQVDVQQLVADETGEAGRADCLTGVAGSAWTAPAGGGPAAEAAAARTATGCGDGTGLVPYNSDPLSKEAFGYRKQIGITPLRNVAVARVPGWNDPKTGDLVYGVSKGNGYHSENDILDQLKARGFDPTRITALYSERQPCPACGPLLENSLAKGTPVSWSVPWGADSGVNRGADRLLNSMIRDNGGFALRF